MTGTMFLPACYLAAALLALWLYVRFPDRRPKNLKAAIARVVLAFAAFFTLPIALAAYRSAFHGQAAGMAFVLAFALPMLIGVMLSWLWFLARVLHDFGPDLPSGGHPATNGT